jgi:cysteine desulfurase
MWPWRFVEATTVFKSYSLIYLDNSATTQIDLEVIEAMEPYLHEGYGNASSVHELGRKSRVALENAREIVAKFIGADTRELVFTSSGTEANNAAIKGPIFQQRLVGKPFDQLSIVTSPVEHEAVLQPAKFLESLGVRLSLVKMDEGGRVGLSGVGECLTSDTTLLSLMLVNNEVGAINDIAMITRQAIATAPQILIHTDAVQALGKIPIDVRQLGAHFASFSAHKIHGPKGIGALYVKSGTKSEPLVHGGAQERNRRGGTESVALAVGFAKAVELAEKRMAQDNLRVELLGRRLRNTLEAIPDIVINSPSEQWLPWILNFSFAPELLARIDGEALLIRFDLEGVAVSNGSACTSGTMQPSHVLLAMGKGSQVASKSIRVSLSHHTTEIEIEQFIDTLVRLMPR